MRYDAADLYSAEQKFYDYFSAPRWRQHLEEAALAVCATARVQVEMSEFRVLAHTTALGAHLSRYTMLDHPTARGGTILGRFLAEAGARLSAAERQALEAMRRSTVGLYELCSRAGGQVELRDLWLDRPAIRIAEDESLPRAARAGDLLVARLFGLPGGENVFACESLHLTASPAFVVDLMEAHMMSAQDDGLVMSREAFLKRCPPVLMGVWVEEHGVEPPQTPGGPRAAGPAPSYPCTVVELSSALGEDGGLGCLSERDRRLIYYWGRIAYGASALDGELSSEVDVWCRRRPANRPCETPLEVKPPGESGEVHWRCPGCGDAGLLRGWRGTAFDARWSGAQLAGEAVAELRINGAEWRHLTKLAPLPPRALALLVGARISPFGGWLEGPAATFEELTVALGDQVRAELGRNTIGALVQLHRQLSRVAGRRPYRLPEGVVCSLENPGPEGLGLAPREGAGPLE